MPNFETALLLSLPGPGSFLPRKIRWVDSSPPGPGRVKRESLKKLGLCSRTPYFQRNMVIIIRENQNTRKENQFFAGILMTKAKRTIVRNFKPKQKYALQDMMLYDR